MIRILLILSCVLAGCQDTTRVAAPINVRYLIGADQSLPDNVNVPSLSEMQGSMRLRRTQAWRVLEHLLEDTVSQQDPSFHFPRWLAFYDRQDLETLIPIFGNELQKRKPLDRVIQSTIRRHEKYLNEIPYWTPKVFKAWRDSLQNSQQISGAFGLGRSSYNLSAVQTLLSEHNTAANCEGLTARNHELDLSAANNFSLCLSREFSSDSMIVKAAWIRIGSDSKLPLFKTDPESFARRIHQDEWGNPDTFAEVNANSIFIMEISGGQRYALVGLHVALKQYRDWQWISMWWGADNHQDFASERPDSGVFKSGSSWANYKMCTTVGYKESPESWDAEDLGVIDNLKQWQHAFPERSWCSNPYLEKGLHNFSTNCIGCHQNAGTPLTDTEILDHGALLRLDRVRKNFPSDYVFGVTRAPDHWSARFRAIGSGK